tara:strand:- start:303 stop:671 length:369 start_codon:yes stop_codon:yes gene_type:complete
MCPVSVKIWISAMHAYLFARRRRLNATDPPSSPAQAKSAYKYGEDAIYHLPKRLKKLHRKIRDVETGKSTLYSRYQKGWPRGFEFNSHRVRRHLSASMGWDPAGLHLERWGGKKGDKDELAY